MSAEREIAAEDSIRVVCRFRPLNDSEEKAGSKVIVKFPNSQEENCLSIGVSIVIFLFDCRALVVVVVVPFLQHGKWISVLTKPMIPNHAIHGALRYFALNVYGSVTLIHLLSFSDGEVRLFFFNFVSDLFKMHTQSIDLTLHCCNSKH